MFFFESLTGTSRFVCDLRLEVVDAHVWFGGGESSGGGLVEEGLV